MKRPDLNTSLVLEGPVKASDGAGGYTQTWEPLGLLWAEVVARSGREVAVGQAPVSRVVYRITVRAAPQEAPSRPVAGQRFRNGARVFNINAVAEADGTGKYLTCYAEEEVAS